MLKLLVLMATAAWAAPALWRWSKLLGVLLFLACVAGAAIWLFGVPDLPGIAGGKTAAASGPSHWKDGSTTVIRVAHSPDVSPLFRTLAGQYNKAQKTYRVEAKALELEEALPAATGGSLVAITPDSSLVLNDVERAWRAASPDAPPIVGHTVRFATSPVVIAVREERLSAAGVDGWQSLIRSGLRWAHLSSLSTSSGLLALTAEFYAASGATRLQREDVDRRDVLDGVAAIEKSIARYGGGSEEKVVEYLLTGEGRAALDAIVLSEAQVVALNQRGRAAARWRAVYPVEGTLMMDHPLTLLEHPELAPEARRGFLDFARFLASAEAQPAVVEHAYRPAAYQADLANGPLKAENGVNPVQPLLLTLPSPGTLLAMRDYWAGGLKRAANILLVVDLSGSMKEEGRMDQAKKALDAFVVAAAQKGGRDRIGLDAFSTQYRELVPLAPISENREKLRSVIRDLKEGGDTALFYAAWSAQQRLLALGDAERINAVILMTDGLENRSQDYRGRREFGKAVPDLTGNRADGRRLGEVLQAEQRNQPAQVLIFAVGYGKGADASVMRTIATAGSGQYYFAETSTITRLYALIQENF